MQNPPKESNGNTGGKDSLEDRIAAKIELIIKPLKDSIDKLEEQWMDH